MKRIFSLLLCLAMLLSLAACGSSEEVAPTDAVAAATQPAPTAAPTAAPTDAPTEAPAVLPDPAPEIIQLVDNDDVTVYITGIKNNEHLGMQLQIQCANKTDRALMFSWDMVSVCGYMYDPMWAEEVAPGKTANSTIDLDTYVLEKMGIISVDEITFTLRVFDSENWMEQPLVQDVFTIYPTGLTAETARFPARDVENGVVVAEDDNIRFVIEWADAEDGDAYAIYVYMENKTDRNLMYSWDMVSVNDMMVDPFWATVVAAGKKACSEITFYRSELADNGITDVSNVEFTLLVSDYDDWEGGNLLEQRFIYNP